MTEHHTDEGRAQVADDPSGGVLVRIRTAHGELTGALRKVAEQVLADPAGAARSTIVELAERSGTSPATITRFCRALGFDGYAGLRVAIATASGRAAASVGWSVDIGRDIDPGDSLDLVLGNVLSAAVASIQDTAALLDVAAVARAAEAIAGASRVDVYGIGGSALVGAEFQSGLHRIGIPVWTWREVHDGLTSAALLSEGDVAVAVSHSGATVETIEMLAEASSHGALTVAVTSFPAAPITDVADIVLTTCTQTRSFRADVLAARHSQMLVLDLLYVAVAQLNFPCTNTFFASTSRAVAAHRTDRGATDTGERLITRGPATAGA
ncbi:RpiR family transcriptional regulator [Actinorhabdospora filicis]|uniref:RpiR family transcriptional regulator n=1 Tax=Actinorhabdospora filicis TaxID=1785913 RepID=A0A9W6SMV2_9ACTN|nr:MurR/RpiR family transcriptional regulator [Actinorhabdospora filicis]GLZ78781.1 RpiR family transcriptional regulator [Actinorhabdospora filicis]